MMPSPLTEHVLLCVSAFIFPPVALVVFLVVVLATLGKSLGLREIYVRSLIRVFEWGARQIKTGVREAKRKESQLAVIPAHLDTSSSNDEQSEEEDEEEDEEEEEDAKTAKSDGYESQSTVSGRRRHNSGTSTSSRAASVCSFRRRQGSGSNIIRRDTQLNFEDGEDLDSLSQLPVQSRGWAVIHDSVDFIKNGIESIIEDEVTSRFEAEQLACWNMLTRTSIRFYQFVNWKMTALWGCGFFFRYFLMLPLRVTLFAIGLIFMLVSTAAVGILPNGALKRKMNEKCMLTCHRILSRSLSTVVYFHDSHYKARGGGIAVANHTSPMDVMVLSTDNVYALIGQRQGGLLGLMQRALSRASSHIWFDRSEAKDRSAVTNMLREHTNDPNKLPILIFPEGTCINNTSVMMFKKGSFEVGAKIYPIAMKYDSRFGDAFWNSSEQSWGEYILRMMTSWAIICNVYYLPPMERMLDEDAIDFASRVKKEIARKGGLVDLEWDGMLKRSRVPPKLIAKQQEKYFHRLSRYTSTSEHGPSNNSPIDAEQDDEGIASPFLSGCNSLEQLPEDAVVDESEEEEEPSLKERSSSARLVFSTS